MEKQMRSNGRCDKYILSTSALTCSLYIEKELVSMYINVQIVYHLSST